jgi:hypothetical protein
MERVLKTANDGSVQSNEGWALRFVSPNLIEYVAGSKVCLVNVESPRPPVNKRRIHATESASPHFPELREHIQHAAGLLKGAFEVV